jgi:hypothetical protein
MNKLLTVTFKQTKTTTALSFVIQGLKTNKIDVDTVSTYDFRNVMLPGRIMLIDDKIKMNDKKGLVYCLTEGEKMSHLFKKN